jgi:hypothetical protein
LRLWYYPQDESAMTALRPPPAGQPTGVLISRFGLCREPFYGHVRANCLQTFTHCHSGRTVTVPLWLPPDTPRVEQLRSGIAYNYGAFAVEVYFLPDGSVEVVYNNGLR